MQLKSLLAATLAWSTTTGLLVPPDTSGEALEALAASPGIQGDVISVRVPCYGCPVAQDKNEEGIRTFAHGGKNTDIVLEFQQRDGGIFLGGNRIYPANVNSAVDFSGKQVKMEGSDDDFAVTDDELRLSTRLDVHAKQALSDTVTSTELALEVLGIEGRVVHVGTVSFHVLESSEHDSNPLLARISLVPTVTTAADAQCSTVLCRVRAQMLAKLAAIKAGVTKAAGKVKAGCAKMMGMHRPHGCPHGAHIHEDGNANVIDRLKGGPNKFRGHHGHGVADGKKPCPGRRHGFVHKMAYYISMAIRHIFIPILLGFFAGIAVVALGMVVGRIISAALGWLFVRPTVAYILLPEAGSDEVLPVYEAGEHVPPPAYQDEKKEMQV